MINTRRPSVQLAAGIIGLALMGVTYSWSFFILPLEQEFGWQRSATSAIFSAFIIFYSAGILSAGALMRRWSEKRVLRVVALLFFVGFWASSRVHELWQIFLSYGVLCGFASGLGNNGLMTSVTRWFPDRIGFSSGILSMGYGGGSLLLGWVIAWMNQCFGWREAFQLLGTVFFVALLILTAVLQPAPRTESTSGAPGAGLSPRQMLRTRSFWLYYLWSVGVLCIGLTILGSGAALAAELTVSPHAIATVTGILSLCNGLGRVIVGKVSDRYGIAPTLAMITALTLCGGIGTFCALYFRSLPLLGAAFAVTGLGYGGPGTCGSIIAWRLFGREHYSSNYSILSTNGIPASVIGSAAMGALLTGTGSYPLTYLTVNLYGLAAVALLAHAVRSGALSAGAQKHPNHPERPIAHRERKR